MIPHRGDGEERKARALAALERRCNRCVLQGRRALLHWMLEKGIATADDVRAAVPLPSDVDARCFGAVPGPLANLGIIRHCGFQKSTRRERHGSYMTVWELADREAAIAWLQDNPEPEDQSAGQQELFGLK